MQPHKICFSPTGKRTSLTSANSYIRLFSDGLGEANNIALKMQYLSFVSPGYGVALKVKGNIQYLSSVSPGYGEISYSNMIHSFDDY